MEVACLLILDGTNEVHKVDLDETVKEVVTRLLRRKTNKTGFSNEEQFFWDYGAAIELRVIVPREKDTNG